MAANSNSNVSSPASPVKLSDEESSGDDDDDDADVTLKDDASVASSTPSNRSIRLADRNLIKSNMEMKLLNEQLARELKQQTQELETMKNQLESALQTIAALNAALNLERNVHQLSSNCTSSSSSYSSSTLPSTNGFDETTNHTVSNKQANPAPEQPVELDSLNAHEEAFDGHFPEFTSKPQAKKNIAAKPKPSKKRPAHVKLSTNEPQIAAQTAQQHTSSDKENARNEKGSEIKRVPPIVTYGLKHKEATERLTKVLGHSNFQMETINNTCSVIRCNSPQTHQLIQADLKDKVDFHTFTPHENRKISIVMKNLSSTYDAADIKQALENLKLQISIYNVTPYVTDTSVRQKKNLRIWLIQLDPGSDSQALLKTRGILNQIVKFEVKKQSRIPQCKNCQRFKHTASNCNRRYRCVKCVGDHRPRECPLDEL